MAGQKRQNMMHYIVIGNLTAAAVYLIIKTFTKIDLIGGRMISNMSYKEFLQILTSTNGTFTLRLRN